MLRPWVKICGLTRADDARLALRLGARYVGCILQIPRSPRSLSVESAAPLAEAAPGALVLVTESLDPQALGAALEALRPAALQLHAPPCPEALSRLRETVGTVSLWQVLAVAPQAADREGELQRLLTLADACRQAGADAVLLDALVGGQSGGTGRTCDWELAAQMARAAPLPVILAGGLGPENLTQAARTVCPAGLDVSSGVEERPGLKCPQRLAQLFALWRKLT